MTERYVPAALRQLVTEWAAGYGEYCHYPAKYAVQSCAAEVTKDALLATRGQRGDQDQPMDSSRIKRRLLLAPAFSIQPPILPNAFGLFRISLL